MTCIWIVYYRATDRASRLCGKRATHDSNVGLLCRRHSKSPQVDAWPIKTVCPALADLRAAVAGKAFVGRSAQDWIDIANRMRAKETTIRTMGAGSEEPLAVAVTALTFLRDLLQDEGNPSPRQMFEVCEEALISLAEGK